MTSAECIAKALLEPGFKITQRDWKSPSFVQLSVSSSLWVEEDGNRHHCQIHPKYDWIPYEEPVNMVTWYRPKLVWHKGEVVPKIYSTFGAELHPHKNPRFWFGNGTVKVISWYEEEAPETWGQVI